MAGFFMEKNDMIILMHKQFNTTLKRYYAFTFLKDFAFFSAVLVPFFTQWGHISLLQVQLLQSWFMFWQFVLDIPTGIIADHIGRKYVLIAGVLIDAVGALEYGSIASFPIFLLGEFLMSVGISLVGGADSALLYDALKEEGKEDEIKKITGRAQSLNLLGLFISAPIGSFIAAKFGLNVPMLMSAVPLVLAGFVAYTIREPKFHKEIEKQSPFVIAKEGLKFFYGHKTLRILTIDGIIVASAAYFVIWLYQPLLQQVHVPIFFFGFITPILVGAEIVITHQFVHIEGLLGSAKKYIAITAILTAFGFFAAGLFPSIWTVLLLVIFAGGFGLTRMDLMSSYMNTFIPSEQRATVLSTISMFRRFGLVILNPLIGLAADHSLQLALIILGIFPLLIFFFSPVEQKMFEEN